MDLAVEMASEDDKSMIASFSVSAIFLSATPEDLPPSKISKESAKRPGAAANIFIQCEIPKIFSSSFSLPSPNSSRFFNQDSLSKISA